MPWLCKISRSAEIAETPWSTAAWAFLLRAKSRGQLSLTGTVCFLCPVCDAARSCAWGCAMDFYAHPSFCAQEQFWGLIWCSDSLVAVGEWEELILSLYFLFESLPRAMRCTRLQIFDLRFQIWESIGVCTSRIVGYSECMYRSAAWHSTTLRHERTLSIDCLNEQLIWLLSSLSHSSIKLIEIYKVNVAES